MRPVFRPTAVVSFEVSCQLKQVGPQIPCSVDSISLWLHLITRSTCGRARAELSWATGPTVTVE